MLRLTRLARAGAAGYRGRNPYKVLGIAKAASQEQIKKAYHERAKEVHPDAGKRAAPGEFKELADAYRLLKDPYKRKQYDTGETGTTRAPSDGGFRQGTKQGGFNSSSDRTAGAGPRPKGSGPPGIGRNEILAISVVMGSGFFFLSPFAGTAKKQDYVDPDPHPNRFPENRRDRRSKREQKNYQAKVQAKPAEDGAQVDEVEDFLSKASAEDASEPSPEDELVKAFWDPFSERWQKIPEGYEPPGPVDLTSWHKKRIDILEWNRMFAEGKLSQIIPRGGLAVRWVPGWEAVEPILLCDPITGKTIAGAQRLPRRDLLKGEDEIQF